MARQIALTRTPYRADGASFRYVYSANGAGSPTTPNEIFVMQLVPLNPATGTKTAVYSSVASVSQLTDLPVGTVTGNGSYYRTATYEQIYTSRDDADSAWAALQASVDALIRALKAGDATLAPETVTLVG